MQNSFPVQN